MKGRGAHDTISWRDAGVGRRLRDDSESGFGLFRFFGSNKHCSYSYVRIHTLMYEFMHDEYIVCVRVRVL